METPKILTSQSNPEQREQCGRYHKIYIQVILQSYKSRISTTLSQMRTSRPTDTEPEQTHKAPAT